MKLATLMVLSFFSLSTFAVSGNPNGGVLECMDARIDDKSLDYALCLKAQQVFLSSTNPDPRMKSFNEIMTAALADLPTKKKKLGNTAKAHITLYFLTARAKFEQALQSYTGKIRSCVTNNSKVKSYYSDCYGDSRAYRFFSNSCTNLAQKVASVFENKMEQMGFGHNLRQNVLDSLEGLASDLEYVASIDRRFDFLLTSLESERRIVLNLADEYGQKVIDLNTIFHSFNSKYTSELVTYAHREEVLKDIKALGIYLK